MKKVPRKRQKRERAEILEKRERTNRPRDRKRDQTRKKIPTKKGSKG